MYTPSNFCPPVTKFLFLEANHVISVFPLIYFSILLLIFHTYTNMNTSFSENGITLYIQFFTLTFFIYMSLLSSHEKNILSDVQM